MPTEKVSLSLSHDIVEEARARVGRRRLSAYVDSALRLKLQHDRLRGLLGELDEEFGSIPLDLMKEAAGEWPVVKRTSRSA